MPPKAKAKQPQEGVQEVDENQIRPGPRMVWNEVQSINATTGRCHHHATWFDGKLVTFGGWSGAGKQGHVEDISYFDAGTNQWCSFLGVEGSAHPGTSQAAMVDFSGLLYFFGGWTGKVRSADVTAYSLDSNSWNAVATTGDKPQPLTFHTATYANKRAYIFGGNGMEGQTAEMYFLDLTTKAWTHTASLGAPSKRSSHTATLVNDTLILIFGGRGGADGSQALNDVALFDTSNNHWMIGVKVDGVPPPRYGHTAIAMRNKVVVFGGVGDQGQLLNDAWVLEVEKANQLHWSRIQSDGQIPSPRTGHFALESMGSMYVVGGRTEQGANKTTSDIFSMDLGPIAPLPSTSGTVMSNGDAESFGEGSIMSGVN